MNRIPVAIALIALVSGCASQPVTSDSLTITDYVRLLDARDQAFQAPTGQQAAWINVTTGMGGTVTPVDDTRVVDGKTCRQLRQVTRATTGRVDDRTTTACLDNGVLSVEED